MTTLKWGIIGSGKIARRFAADLRLIKDAKLAGVISQNSNHAEDFASDFETQAYPALDDLLTEADIVYVATPHSNHAGHMLAAIDACKPVLCEKPFTMDSAEAEAVIRRAQKKNVFVMEAMWTRFFPVVEEVLQRVASGAIGEIESIESSFGYVAPFDPFSRVFDLKLGGGSLLDVGVYCVSLALMLCGEEPEQIHGIGDIGPTGADESAQWSMEFRSGTKALGTSSVVKPLANEAIIIGKKGSILIPRFWSPTEYILDGQRNQFELDGSGFQFEAMEVMNCVRAGKIESEKMPWSHSLKVMRTLDKIREQWGLKFPADRQKNHADL